MGFLSLPPRPGLACDCFDEQLTEGVMWVTSSHSVLPLKMNNAKNEIKNTLEATNSRITEAEDRISELEDRMVDK